MSSLEKPLKILITNSTLGRRAGSELYVRDVAIALLRRGHRPVAYSTALGEVAAELRVATVPVVDDLRLLDEPPHLIHGHHHLETMTALLRYPTVPAISFCHGWLPWEEAPPRFPRILRYVAVDETCRDRLVLESGIAERQVRVLLNFVDLRRFQPRGPLPAVPRRALVFSNSASEENGLAMIRQACLRTGLALDVVGHAAGNSCPDPENRLGQYDIVFAKARCALEALAVGAAVVLCDVGRSGPMVTTAELDRLRRQNFGIRALADPIHPDNLVREICRYNGADAAAVSQAIRNTAGLDAAADTLLSLYREVIAEYAAAGPPNRDLEYSAASEYLQRSSLILKSGLAAYWKDRVGWNGNTPARTEEPPSLIDNHQAEVHRLQTEIEALRGSLTWRLTQGLLQLPVVRNTGGPIARWLSRRFASPRYRNHP